MLFNKDITMIKQGFLALWTVALLAIAGCASQSGDWEGDNSITQVAPVEALAAGLYDGSFPVSELQLYGDTGVGTFDSLDGELIMVDGRIYKVRSDGRVVSPSTGETTPFAAAAKFNPDIILLVNEPTDFAGLQARIARETAKKNYPLVIRVEGSFEWVRTRSVPKQEKPYPPLVKVTAKQPEFNIKNVDGVIVGFRMPSYVKSAFIPGLHCHFISDQRDCGGHVLDLKMRSGKIFIGTCEKVSVVLPRNAELFSRADLSKDRTAEIHQAENKR